MRGVEVPSSRPLLLVVSTHPAQTYVDLYSRLAESDVMRLHVLFARDTTGGFRDREFNRDILWDIDLLAGYESHFLQSGSRWSIRLGGVKDARLTVPSLSMVLETLRTVRRMRPDVVLIPGHGDLWYLVVWTICRFLRIPYIVRGTGVIECKRRSFKSSIGSRVARAFVGGSAVFCYVGVANYFFGLLHGAKSLIFSPYAVSLKRFERTFVSDDARATMRATRGLVPDVPVVVFSGKLQQWKRPQDVILALHLISRPVQAVLLGDGPMREGLERLACELGVMVRFAGFVNQSDIPDWYALGDVFVLPSGPGGDTWGLVVNEALALGLTPVVSDSVPSWPDLAWAEGAVFPTGSVEQLAECVLGTLARRADPDHHRALRATLARYSIDAAAEGVEAAVRQALAAETEP